MAVVDMSDAVQLFQLVEEVHIAVVLAQAAVEDHLVLEGHHVLEGHPVLEEDHLVAPVAEEEAAAEEAAVEDRFIYILFLYKFIS